MKGYFIFTLLIILVGMAATTTAQVQSPAPPPAADDYAAFAAQMTSAANLDDCIARMDQLIDAGEQPPASRTGLNMVAADTKNGFHMEFCVVSTKSAIIYYLVFSRKGLDLTFSDATKMIALFCDRAGLPHPIIITEGEKPVFYAQWLIKPSDWKDLRKMMLKVRAENRAEKDPQKAFVTAVVRELNARQAAQSKEESP
ncbi:MAG TPA: hypothetical protein VMI53_13510 [Opitutaceae bacterium]|nr:hypothetical protein [Opitutaceae bacterium]